MCPPARPPLCTASHSLNSQVLSFSPTEGLGVLHVLEGHRSVVGALGFAADGARACTCSLDRTVKVTRTGAAALS